MNKTVLITGATGGFGFEFAKLFAQHGNDLILVARTKDTLAKIAEEIRIKYGKNVMVIAKDLSQKNASQDIYDEVMKSGSTVHTLVNNAGFATYGEFVHNDTQEELDELQVNIIALTHLTKLFLPGMVKRNEGGILNVASTAAFTPGPLMAVYYASKAYSLSFSEALSEELQGTGVTVTVLCPGPADTGFVKRARLESSPLFRGKLQTPEEVVAKGYAGLVSGERVVIVGVGNMILTKLVGFVPRILLVKTIKKLQQPQTK